MKKIFTAILLIFCGSGFAEAESAKFKINKKKFDQGEVTVIQSVGKSTASFTVQFLKRKYSSFEFDRKPTVLIGIHYQLRPGTYTAVAQYGNEAPGFKPFIIQVKEKFPKLEYSPPKRPAKEQERINKEAGGKRAVLKRLDFRPDSIKSFWHPVHPVVVNSPFGEKRCRNRIVWKLFNCRYHLGTDYRAAFDEKRSKPVLVRAINDGKIVMADTHEIDGKIVIIDHGNGISAEYLHLSKFLVSRGQLVKRGQAIGIAGQTGATEAIHLHLTIKMDKGKTIIDPELLFDLE